MYDVPTLAFQFCADPPFFHIKGEVSICRIAQVPVPAILPGRLLRTTNSRYSVHHIQCFVQQHTLVLVDDCVYLRLHALPHLVKALLTNCKFVPEAIKVPLNTELVV